MKLRAYAHKHGRVANGAITGAVGFRGLGWAVDRLIPDRFRRSGIQALRNVPVLYDSWLLYKFPGLWDVNPGNWLQKLGRTTNCSRCVVATERVLAGGRASAMPYELTAEITGWDQHMEFMDEFGPNVKLSHAFTNTRDLETLMEQWGHNSRVIVSAARKGDIGHFFNAINLDGIVHFVDGQVGGSVWSMGQFERFTIFRTDQLGPAPLLPPR